MPSKLIAPLRTIAALAGVSVIAIGCVSNTPDPAEAVKNAPVLDPNIKVASSQTLKNFYDKFDAVYHSAMAPTDKKIAPIEKTLVQDLQSRKDIKAWVNKNREIFESGVKIAKDALVTLSRSTSHGVDPMEHDKYVAYYTAVGERISARRDEYQAFLEYAAKPNDDNRALVLDAARNVKDKDEKHKELQNTK